MFSRQLFKVSGGLLRSARPAAAPVRNLAPRAMCKSTEAWVPSGTDELHKVTIQSLVHEISLQQMESVQTVVPWFLKSMPEAYFRQVPDKVQRHHLKAVASIYDLNQNDLSLRIESKDAAGVTDITMIDTRSKPGQLLQQLNTVGNPSGSHLSRVRIFSSTDGELNLNIFSFSDNKGEKIRATNADAASIYGFLDTMKDGSAYGKFTDVPAYNEAYHNPASMEEYLKLCPVSYVKESRGRRFLTQRAMYEEVKSTESTVVHVENNQGSGGPPTGSSAWITVAAGNVLPDVLLKLVAGVLYPRKLNIWRSHLDRVDDPTNDIPANGHTATVPGSVTMLRLLVSPNPLLESTTSLSVEENLEAICTDVKRCKWLDPSTTELGLQKFPQLGVRRAEIITSMCAMLHGPLAKLQPDNFTGVKSVLQVIETQTKALSIASAIADTFMDRFDPKNKGDREATEERFRKNCTDLRKTISALDTDSSRLLLSKMIEVAEKTKRTNFFRPDRYALSYRLDPTIMFTPADFEKNKPVPYGLIFSHGRHFNGFHNRFRDIARGGLRIVTPPNADVHSLESTRHYDEVYGLSYAQQLKNKDIPEGGSKAVVLVNTPVIAPEQRNFAVRKAIKGFTDSVLGLIIEDELFEKHCVDHLGKSELIYLGPDEQVVPGDIDWIIRRAEQRGYPCPAAYMSSKQGAGINHKEYGVTSEGVVCFLDVALRNVLHIDPHNDPFTVKITGGPDGDVGGNLLKILFRDYGSNAKIVGIADGSGVAEDPEGLDHDELLRLFYAGAAIAEFDRSKLSSTGLMMDVSTDEGKWRRDTMHNRVKADAFVPAGGRPNTSNKDNWHMFLDENGEPTSKLIVEGANIFHTPEAREGLRSKGVSIVKDSSANKCGVVTSSCEIAASMLLSREEFLEIKTALVADVLVHLRKIALQEAELLFREYKNYPGSLPHFSERISFAIGNTKDALTDYLADYSPGDALFEELMPLVKDSLPKKLQEVAWDRAPTHFPVQYMRNAMASTLGARLVYHEGIHLVEGQPKDKLAERAIEYYRASLKVGQMVHDLEKSGADYEVIRLLKKGGARSSLDIF